MIGGKLLLDCLEAQGCRRLFCVPGESFLPVLDALYDSTVAAITARQEGGAAIMAEAEGKLTGRPGVCFASRGPGATNAASGLHVAQQDSTPMLLCIGQIEGSTRGRDAFQEVDYRQTFGDLAKWVEEVDRAERIPEVVSRAYHVAMSGRPGPVVLVFPEEVLRASVTGRAGPRVEVAEPAPTPEAIESLGQMLAAAQRPFLILGGSRWNEASVEEARRFAECWKLPVSCSFRRQHLFDHTHPHYAGDVGLGINPELKARIAKSDLLLLLGGRFSENPSQGFTLLEIPQPGRPVVHVHPGPEELGRIYTPSLAINATPGAFLRAARSLDPSDVRWSDAQAQKAHAEYQTWSDEPPESPSAVQIGEVITHLREVVPADAIVTNGAGNYALWVNRFWRYPCYGSQLAPTSGSMGYGLPAAVSAKLRHPEREVICFAGDGCFQMTGQEFSTAVQYGADVVVLVIDNGSLGTIRMHQERAFPGRVSATDLTSPDFAALARAYGGHGETVERTDEFAAAWERARASGLPALLHLKVDLEAIAPGKTLSGIRKAASDERSG